MKLFAFWKGGKTSVWIKPLAYTFGKQEWMFAVFILKYLSRSVFSLCYVENTIRSAFKQPILVLNGLHLSLLEPLSEQICSWFGVLDG